MFSSTEGAAEWTGFTLGEYVEEPGKYFLGSKYFCLFLFSIGQESMGEDRILNRGTQRARWTSLCTIGSQTYLSRKWP